MLTDTATALGTALPYALLAAATYLTLITAYEITHALHTRTSMRRHLIGLANARIFSLSRTLRIDLPQFDARTRAQRAEDAAFMALGATYHREQ